MVLKEKFLLPTARLRLYIDCEIMSGPGLRSGSSEKDIVLQEAQEDVQGRIKESVPTGIIKEARDIKDLQGEEERNITEGIQKEVNRLSLKDVQEGLEGKTHIPETAVRHADQGTKDQLHGEHKAITQKGRQEVKQSISKGVQGGEDETKYVIETTAREESSGRTPQLKLQVTEMLRAIASAGGSEEAAGQYKRLVFVNFFTCSNRFYLLAFNYPSTGKS